MNKQIILAAFFLTISASTFGQITTTDVKVSYDGSDKAVVKANNAIEWFLNDVPFGKFYLILANEDIKELKVDKDGANGKIFIYTKPEASLNFLSLHQLKDEYLKSTSSSVLYMLDGAVLKTDNYKIDEKYILSINVTPPESITYLQSEKKSFAVVNIITRSKDNLEKASQIKIRGGAEATGK
ncbi:MAG: hypothetical protein V4687_00480 [Bacteroidota bacterium]